MGTRARIGFENRDGSITSVYHHWDGYSSWLGVKLNEHYNTRQKAKSLISGGDMSVCLDDDGNPNPMYYSQGGENCPPRTDADYHEYTNVDCGEEFHYIWTTDDEWICIDQHQYDGTDQAPELVQIPGFEVV